MTLILTNAIKNFLTPGRDYFDQIMALRGETFRELENRRTQRVKLGEKYYFIKQHFGIGWKEIIKNFCQLRPPVYSAKNEWLALQLLHKLNIATQKMVAYGIRGINPAKIQSFLITEELPAHISLEHLTASWQKNPPPARLKHQLIREVARIARTLHQQGINHRDFYLCHFLLPLENKTNKLYLIDLHRAQIRKRTPLRWIIKDLAGLYFSSKNSGLTPRDLLRFMKEYRNKPLHDVLNKEAIFWHKVKQRGDKLYREQAN